VRLQVAECQSVGIPPEDAGERADEPVFQHAHATDAPLVEVLPLFYQPRWFRERNLLFE
jgi:hypothetical protein